MGDLFDATPKDLISKVFIEEKMFKTCCDSRSVLIGDAWHKSMKDSGLSSINWAFGEYYKQRYGRNVAVFNGSATFAKFLNGQKIMERLFRTVVLKVLTHLTLKSGIRKDLAYQLQIAYLPLIENRGNGPVLPQEFGESTLMNVAGV
ncbi:hypothetical protein BGZ80_004613 [Entomortierella chlamydospora]|uniref:Uncharacterized protein n=1 Tax=Entomortierella chlamydospora TaxID=101097 RepID=A0A9P6MMA8_9FUNG|nr:hypothetical protein BGZ80_004613 [Entomortierella chlamydospora]